MKILKKILLALLGLLILFAAFIQFAPAKKYDAPLPEVRISTDSATLARGEYLIYGPAHCAGCHGDTSATERLRLKEGASIALSGGNSFDTPLGKIYIPNITPDETGIGTLSNEAIARSMRYAVNHKDHVMIPVMPFTDMSEADVNAVISYLRAQDPVVNAVPSNTYTFFGKLLTRLFLKPYNVPEEIPVHVKIDTTVAYGAYLANSVANCKGCHSTFNMQTMTYNEPFYQGGTEFDEGGDHLYLSPNLTPDPTTGHIYNWSEDDFVARFKAGRVFEDSPMAWEGFLKMEEPELRAIYRYLQTLDPVENEIGPTAIAKK